jgi:hypothetical protein
MTKTEATDRNALVGPAEIAAKFGVKRATIGQWRKRYADFPEPVAVLDDGRRGVAGGHTGRGSPGMLVWQWWQIVDWAKAHGRIAA